MVKQEKSSSDLQALLSELMKTVRLFVTSNDPVQFVVDICFLISVLDFSHIEEWLSIEDKEKRIKYLTNALSQRKFERLLGIQVAENVDREFRYAASLIKMAKMLQLPNPLIANEFHRLLSTNSKGVSVLPSELAELMVKLVWHGKEPAGKALCMGLMCDQVAMESSKGIFTRYEIHAVGVGRQWKLKLFTIAGAKVEFPNQDELARASIFETYECGYLAESWNSEVMAKVNRGNFGFSSLSLSSEVMALEGMFDRVNGRIACIVSPSWLAKTSGDDLEFKAKLIEEKRIEAVIQLPPKILPLTSVPPTILILNTEKKTKLVQFINAGGDEFLSRELRSEYRLTNLTKILLEFYSDDESDISEYKSTKAIVGQNYNMDVKRYISSDEKDAINNAFDRYSEVLQLSNIADLISCHSIKSKQKSEFAEDANKTVREVGPRNISDIGTIDSSDMLNTINIDDSNGRQIERQSLEVWDILFVIKGQVGKVALVDKSQSCGVVANQSFVIIRLKPSSPIPPKVLFQFLSSEVAKAQIEQAATGAAMKTIKMQDLRNLDVPVPTIDEQKEVVQTHGDILRLYNEKRDIEEKISKAKLKHWSLNTENLGK